VKRTVELEVDARGEVNWREGSLELAPNVAAAIRELPPRTLVKLEGTYERPTADVKILTVTRKPLAITPALDRAIEARRDDLAHFRDVIAGDPSVTARVLCAELAAHEGRRADAHVHVREALALGIPDALTQRLAHVWHAVAPVELAPELQDALFATVWMWTLVWNGWADPITTAAQGYIAPRDQVVPWNVGGPRVEPDRQLVAAWLLDRIERIATPIDDVGTRELRAMTDAERLAWRTASEARDEAAEASADRDADRRFRVHDDDSGDEDIDPGPLERDEPLLAWLRFHTHDGYGDAVSDLAGDLRRATERIAGTIAARDAALATDAAVLLSVLAPELVHDLERVVLVRAAMRGGFAVVRCAGELVLIRAPNGAFGTYELVRGDAAVLAAASPHEAAVTEALVGPADAPCRVVADDPIVRRIAAARREPVAPVAPIRPAPPIVAPPAERFVRHPTFGRGRVIEQRGDKLVIEFATAGTKTLLARFVEPV